MRAVIDTRRARWSSSAILVMVLYIVTELGGLHAQQARAQTSSFPALASVSGAPQTGSTLEITGSGFKTHGDFHGATDKLARVFDNFNDGSLRENDYLTWGIHNESQGPAVLRTDNPRTSASEDGHYRRTNVGLGFLYTGGGNHQEYYSSFYMRLSDGFDITSASSGTHQFKISRLYSRNCTANFSTCQRINLYPAIGHSDGFHYMFEHLKPQALRSWSQMNGIPDRPSGWHKVSMWYKKSSATGANDGRARLWWDNKLMFDWYTQYSNPANDPNNVISGDFDSDDGDLAGDWTIGDYFSSASPATWVDFDDIYLSHTQARVELCDASSYSACSVIETQEPVAWTDSHITAKINLGALQTSSPLYAYVVDKDGNVNANGLPLSAGPPPDHPPAGLTMISEDFNSSASNFDVVEGGTWGLAGGRYTLTDPAAATPHGNLAIHTTEVMGDLTISAEVSTTASSGAWDDASLVFDYQDPLNYYFLSVNESNDSATKGIFRYAGGVLTELADIATPFVGGENYRLRIDRIGSEIKAYRDDELIATASDSTFLGGRVGFGTRNDGASFDNLTVGSVPPG